jgi:hypothetical protein
MEAQDVRVGWGRSLRAVTAGWGQFPPDAAGEVPQPQEPATPAVPEAPVTPAAPDPGTPGQPVEPATVPPPEEPATPVVPEPGGEPDDVRIEQKCSLTANRA